MPRAAATPIREHAERGGALGRWRDESNAATPSKATFDRGQLDLDHVPRRSTVDKDDTAVRGMGEQVPAERGSFQGDGENARRRTTGGRPLRAFEPTPLPPHGRFIGRRSDGRAGRGAQ